MYRPILRHRRQHFFPKKANQISKRYIVTNSEYKPVSYAIIAKDFPNQHRQWPQWQRVLPSKPKDSAEKPSEIEMLIAMEGQSQRYIPLFPPTSFTTTNTTQIRIRSPPSQGATIKKKNTVPTCEKVTVLLFFKIETNQLLNLQKEKKPAHSAYQVQFKMGLDTMSSNMEQFFDFFETFLDGQLRNSASQKRKIPSKMLGRLVQGWMHLLSRTGNLPALERGSFA